MDISQIPQEGVSCHKFINKKYLFFYEKDFDIDDRYLIGSGIGTCISKKIYGSIYKKNNNIEINMGIYKKKINLIGNSFQKIIASIYNDFQVYNTMIKKTDFYAYGSDFDKIKNKGFQNVKKRRNKKSIKCLNSDELIYIIGKENLFEHDYEYINGRILYI